MTTPSHTRHAWTDAALTIVVVVPVMGAVLAAGGSQARAAWCAWTAAAAVTLGRLLTVWLVESQRTRVCQRQADAAIAQARQDMQRCWTEDNR
jgi:hypothetical protein